MSMSQKLSPLWNVPYGRNKFFTDRDDALHELHQELQMRDVVALSQPQAITGLGGIGKTQMALEYTYRYRAAYTAVLWVRAASSSELISSFVELARVLNLPECNEQDQRIIIEAVQGWLRLHTGWLLIFDNIDDPSVAESFLPTLGSGRLLFTTRAQALNDIAQCIEVRQMKPEIGALFLLRRAEIIPLQATLDQAGKDDYTIAVEISKELDGLPLALDQAGAYVNTTSCSLREYLTLYQTRRKNLLQERGSLDQNYPASVSTTWSLSFEKLQQAQPAAAELLNFCAFLAPDAIPEAIITGGASHLSDVLAPVVADPLQLDLACKEVLKYSLFHREFDTGTINIHRLVQAVLQDNLPSKPKKEWKQQAVLVINAAFPVVEFPQWNKCEECVPHALVCAAWIEQEQIMIPEAARLLNQAGHYLTQRARYIEAKPLSVRALAIREQLLGPQHLSTATSLQNVANFYIAQGKYIEAEPLELRALAIREHQLDPLHADISTSLNDLAIVYVRQGKYRQAEPLYQRALHIQEQALGPDHPNLAYELIGLASVYLEQGRYAEAELLYQRALRIWEQSLGPEHPNVAHPLNNLGNLYLMQEKYVEAEPLFQRVLHIWEQALGSEHPDVANPLSGLAGVYSGQREYAKAEQFYQRALHIWEQALGPEHSDVAHPLNGLASLYTEQGKYELAEPLCQRALHIREQALGPTHSYTAYSLSNLGELYTKMGRYAEAELLYQRALHIWEQAIGTECPQAALALGSLAKLSAEQNKYEEAKPLYQRALAIYEQSFGTGDPHISEVRKDYAALLRKMGRNEEAALLETSSEKSS